MKKFSQTEKNEIKKHSNSELKDFNLLSHQNRYFVNWPYQYKDSIHILLHFSQQEAIGLVEGPNSAWNQNQEHNFLRALNGIVANQKPEDVISQMVQKCGLDPTIVQDYFLIGPMFMDVNSNRRAWLVLYDYPSSQFSLADGIIKVPTKNVSQLRVADLPTAYLLRVLDMKLKNF